MHCPADAPELASRHRQCAAARLRQREGGTRHPLQPLEAQIHAYIELAEKMTPSAMRPVLPYQPIKQLNL
jgi:hypothetical protein